MNGPDRPVPWSTGVSDDMPERLWVLDTPSAVVDPPGRLTGGLVSLGFLKSALRRGRRVWALTAILGILIGGGLYVKFPPAFKATTSVLLTDNPNQDPAVEVQTDAALAQSTAVGAAVVKQLGLTQSVSSLLAAYSVSVVTDRVLTFTVGAPTSSEAVQRAAAIAAQFLKIRGQYAQIQEQQTVAEVGQQVSQAQQKVTSIDNQISQLSSGAGSSDQQQLSDLRSKRTAAADALAEVQQYQASTLMTLQTATQAMIQGSQVLNVATAQKPSRLKGMPLYVGGGLVGGLAIGAIIVIVGAIGSERLLRRDDVAAALGGPVRLSVRSLGPKRRLPSLGRGGGNEDQDLRLVVEHLRHCIPGSSSGPAGLAVVAVGSAQTIARAVLALIEDAASHGRRVLAADLSGGRDLARMLGVQKPGLGMVNSKSGQLILTVPEPDDVAPIGPLRSPLQLAGYASPSEQLNAASSGADLLITLVTLDPAFGGDHLSTWATDAVVAVTAGETTAARAHAVGELIRLSGTRLDSVILLGADKSDESLGVGVTPSRPATV